MMQPSVGAELFREPPEDFVAARDALARRLMSEGKSEEATAVKSLRRPTVLAWALDRLAVVDPDGVEALLGAGAELRAAQQAALSSKRGAQRLRDATTARRRVVMRLVEHASTALSEIGKDPAGYREGVISALEASSIDAQAADRLRAGTLERPPTESAGFGDVFGLASVPTTGPGDSAEEDAAPRSSSKPGDLRATLKGQVATLRRERDAAARRARTARDASESAERKVSEAKARLKQLDAARAEALARERASDLELRRAERALAKVTERLDGQKG